ncbi:hypothetical protein [Candidatus Thalassolituus haligoni]|jgi:hypothetical protein|uniref:hypothetical protein n=1 Tax=Candidatus Thalassolituus haligoni TaxID=3100113 RepID=UPI0035120AFE|tara:strand:- start:8334 stop:8969 length:636 start_codon:yes stop_codon:yes gene_type:complete
MQQGLIAGLVVLVTGVAVAGYWQVTQLQSVEDTRIMGDAQGEYPSGDESGRGTPLALPSIASDAAPERVEPELIPVATYQGEALADEQAGSGIAAAVDVKPSGDDLQSPELTVETEEWQPPTEQQQALEQQMQQQARQPLNLHLPETIGQEQLTYGTASALLPNVFNAQPQTGSALDLSGKLHWDESEAAETKPLRDTITGAEVELRFKLP